MVDLPGYGYASVSKTERKGWGKMIEGYLRHRENLFCVFVLVDGRVTPQEKDLEFITWLGEIKLPLAIVITKSDKLKRAELSKSITTYTSALLKNWEQLPPLFITSAEKKTGKEDILEFIDKAIKGQL